jgi:hypothetical protein
MVAAAKVPDSPDSILAEALKTDTKGLSSVQTKPMKKSTYTAADNTPVRTLLSQTYSGVSTSQSGSFQAVGFVAVVQREDGVITLARAFGRQDKLSTLDPDSTAMLKSVLESQ